MVETTSRKFRASRDLPGYIFCGVSTYDPD
jgi:hypothetical protein